MKLWLFFFLNHMWLGSKWNSSFVAKEAPVQSTLSLVIDLTSFEEVLQGHLYVLQLKYYILRTSSIWSLWSQKWSPHSEDILKLLPTYFTMLHPNLRTWTLEGACPLSVSHMISPDLSIFGNICYRHFHRPPVHFPQVSTYKNLRTSSKCFSHRKYPQICVCVWTHFLSFDTT